jgi:hypothetical protein
MFDLESLLEWSLEQRDTNWYLGVIYVDKSAFGNEVLNQRDGRALAGVASICFERKTQNGDMLQRR